MPVAFPNESLLAIDGSEEANLAAQAAVKLAGGTTSELHVVHVGLVAGSIFPT